MSAPSTNGATGFRLIYEIDPPREPATRKFFRQLEIFGGVVDAFLIPDNHLGRPALSSVTLAVEACRQGLRPIVALNARDRNHLGCAVTCSPCRRTVWKRCSCSTATASSRGGAT